jgi:hypothetical protein
MGDAPNRQDSDSQDHLAEAGGAAASVREVASLGRLLQESLPKVGSRCSQSKLLPTQ